MFGCFLRLGESVDDDAHCQCEQDRQSHDRILENETEETSV